MPDSHKKRKKIGVLIVGHTGAGKSTLARNLSESLGYPLLCFSDYGRIIGENIGNNYLISVLENEIIDQINKNLEFDSVIIDGISSKSIADCLKSAGNKIITLFLNTEYSMRIFRISKRYQCTEYEAAVIEKEKESAKVLSGLIILISQADILIDGSGSPDELLTSALVKISESIK